MPVRSRTCIPLKQEAIIESMKKTCIKKRLLSIPIISFMSKLQKNNSQKPSVFRNESGVLQKEWLQSKLYVECVICFEVAFQIPRLHKIYPRAQYFSYPKMRYSINPLMKNLEYFLISQYLLSLEYSGTQKISLILI